FNNDGYPDLFSGQDHNTVENEDALVYWGAPEGPRSLVPELPKHQPLGRLLRLIGSRASAAARLPSGGGGRSLLVDLNQDGYPEIVFCNFIHNYPVHMNAYVYWGGPQGYSAERRSGLPGLHSTDAAIEDFNRDGWPDLVFTAGAAHQPDAPSKALIFWGAAGGYSPAHRAELKLNTRITLVPRTADFNRDGFLDLLFSDVDSENVDIFWGAASGNYAPERHSLLQVQSSASVEIADLNQDGWLDVVVFDHVDNGDHGAGANIYWGGRDGYSYSRRHWVPTFGPHFGLIKDTGNIYHRRLEEHYVSPPLEWPGALRLTWKARTPAGTPIAFELRSAAGESELAKAPWRAAAAGRHDPAAGHRWIQYRAVFASKDGGNTPVLEQVTLDPL
ncbi:MAG: VCBS repeat-containing protein, partial [Acidobacteria bacterium]|nr:VCBS repeat-containing protein [Acidobacteriota bacterium]